MSSFTVYGSSPLPDIVFAGAFDSFGKSIPATCHVPFSCDRETSTPPSPCTTDTTATGTTLATSDTFSTISSITTLSFITSDSGTMNRTDSSYAASEEAEHPQRTQIERPYLPGLWTEPTVEPWCTIRVQKWLESVADETNRPHRLILRGERRMKNRRFERVRVSMGRSN